jgi:hypothetical protein
MFGRKKFVETITAKLHDTVEANGGWISGEGKSQAVGGEPPEQLGRCTQAVTRERGRGA